MAKQKQELSMDELLEQVLVPEAEQPYKVPDNWVWTYIGKGFDVTSSKRVHKEDWISDGIPFYRTRELVKLSNGGYIDNRIFISEELYMKFRKEYGVPQKEDLLVSGVGTIGIPYIINSDEKIYFKDGNVIWFKNKSVFLSQYIYYLYKSLFMDNQIHEMSSGTTVDTYTIVNANTTKLPLPPLAEQQRIVDRIESLFTKLDQAKELGQNALDSFANRKAAILHQAFSGELTANWRKEHGVGIDSWEKSTLKQSTEIGSGGTPSRNIPEYYSGNVPWIKTGELLWNYIADSEEHISEKSIANSSARYYPANTVLVAMYGQGLTRGRAAILAVKAATNQAVCALQPKSNLLSRYLYYYFMCHYWDYREKAVGGNQPNYSATMVGKWHIDIPSMPEQQKIIYILDQILAKERQANELAKIVMENIDIMKKSILARAFRGELGTNDPSEENARVLLKKVLQKKK